MKARATCWLKLGGRWLRAGEVFEADAKDLAALGGSAEPCEAPAPAPEPEPAPAEEPAPARSRSRKKK